MATNNATNTSNPVTVAQGGTGQTTLTNHGVLVGAGTSGISATATGSSGQLLVSGGASADPVYTTATYPSTAGTSGNVLTSDGTNWSSSAPPGGGVLSASVTLTSSQIKNLAGTLIQLIAAPGSSKTIFILSAESRFNYGGTNVFTTGGSCRLVYGSSAGGTSAVTGIMTTTQMNGSANYLVSGTLAAISNSASTTDNQVISVWNSGSNYAGNAAGDNTCTVSCTYVVI
jgi:hypothetical protein